MSKKDEQLAKLQSAIKQAIGLCLRFNIARRYRMYDVFDHPVLAPEYWRAIMIEEQLREAEKAVSACIDKPDSLTIETMHLYASGENLERIWQCMFWREYASYNAHLLENNIEELRQRRNRVEKMPFELCNPEASVLGAKAKAISASWRSGIADVLIDELIAELKARDVDAIKIDGDTTFERAFSCLLMAIEEYEAIVVRYEVTVARVKAARGRDGGQDTVEAVVRRTNDEVRRELKFVVRRDDPTSAAARELIGQLDEYQNTLYPAQSNHLVPVEALTEPNVTFLTASADGRLVGCGAFVNHDSQYAEIKRMYVPPEFRGFGIARQILSTLESLALENGLTVARLETGINQPEAVSIYERAGYSRRGPFGSYSEDPLSIFMEKKLTQ